MPRGFADSSPWAGCVLRVGVAATSCFVGAPWRLVRPAGSRPPSRPVPPVSELESALRMEPAAFRAAYSAEKPKLEEENLIFFCQTGKRGSQAMQLARSLGYRGYGAGAPPAGEQRGPRGLPGPVLMPVSTGHATTQGPTKNGSRKGASIPQSQLN